MELHYSADQATMDALVDQLRVQSAQIISNQPGPQGMAQISVNLDHLITGIVTALGTAS